MNLNDPNTSRILAVLIQPIADEDRSRFVADAEKASNIKTFFAGIDKYKRVSSQVSP